MALVCRYFPVVVVVVAAVSSYFSFSFPGTIEPIQLDDCVGLLMYYYKRAQQFIDVIINMMMRRSGDAGERNTSTTRMCTS